VNRPTWNDYFIGIAKAVAERSDCERSKVGAVVVKDRRIRATGYNGSPAGADGCDTCPRRNSGVEPGSPYHNCVAIHAEANALIHCDRSDLQGATVYVTREPCFDCDKLLQGAGVHAVVWPDDKAAKAAAAHVQGSNKLVRDYCLRCGMTHPKEGKCGR
jgi:dCMP deaminase